MTFDVNLHTSLSGQSFLRREVQSSSCFQEVDEMAFPIKEVQLIRDLAARVSEIAAEPIQAVKAGLWRRFNKLEQVKPMVLIFPEGSWHELLPQNELICSHPTCRNWEWDLRRRIYCWEELQDDNVVDDVIVSPIVIRNTDWGMEAQRIRPEEVMGAARFEPVIKTEEDIFKLKLPEISVDWESTERQYQQTCEVFDSLLPVVKRGPDCSRINIVDIFSQWRGIEKFFLDLIDRPEWVHRALQFITDAHLSILEILERENVLSLNNGAHYCGSGGVGFSDELPQQDFDGVHVRAIDLWGYARAQIFSDVSPAMHEEFSLHYEKQLLSRFGLNAYGCCEPLHKKLNLVKQIPQIRRISMSSWVDVEEGATHLEDKYIFSYKPNPSIMASSWDSESVRRSIRNFFEKTRGCIVEIIMKDTHTCLSQPYRMSDWVRIAKEEAERFAV